MGTKGFATLAVLLISSAGLTLVACGNSDSSSSTLSTQEQQAKQAAQKARQRARLRHEARAVAKRAAARRRIRAHRAAERQRHSEEREARRIAAAEAREQEAESSEAESECDPNYSGACLNPYASDYDCEGGSGDGPDYTGEVSVVGEDHYGLDADGDGVGCEPY